MSGFFKDGRTDDTLLTAKELAELKRIGDRFDELAMLMHNARTVGDCKVLDKKADELFEVVE